MKEFNISFLFFSKGAAYFFAALIFAAAVLLTGCSSEQAKAGGFAMPPMPVEVASAKTETIADRFEAVGTIEAIEEVTVVSEIDASVISLPFDEGGYVQKGQLIARLDDSQPAAEVLRTEAIYQQNQSTHKRIKQIVDERAGTAQDLDDASANMKVAEANLALAKARFNKTRIVAPFSGVIGSRRVSVGTFLRAGEPITELANLNEIRITFSAPERYLAQLKRGAEVSVTTPVYPDHEVKGKIIAIEPILDSQTRSARIVARVQNPGQKFRPGMSANVSVILSQRAEAVTIPSEAVFASGDQSFVFVVNPDSSVIRTAIKTGLQLADVVEVKEGIKKDMKVVRAGHQKLFDGAKVISVMSDETVLSNQKDSSSAL